MTSVVCTSCNPVYDWSWLFVHPVSLCMIGPDFCCLTEWEEPGADLDNVIGDTDVRYFMLDSSNIQDMESAVLENPEDTAMWVKLSHRKLADTQRYGSESLRYIRYWYTLKTYRNSINT